MDRVSCPECRYVVGLGIASEPGTCPRCGVPLMHTCELRALSPEEIAAAVRREARAADERARA